MCFLSIEASAEDRGVGPWVSTSKDFCRDKNLGDQERFARNGLVEETKKRKIYATFRDRGEGYFLGLR